MQIEQIVTSLTILSAFESTIVSDCTIDMAMTIEAIPELQIFEAIQAEVVFWYVERQQWLEAAKHFDQGYEMRGCCSACRSECERIVLLHLNDTCAVHLGAAAA